MCYRNPYVQRFRLLVNDPKAQTEYLQQNKTDLSLDLTNIINPLKSPMHTRSTSISIENDFSERPLKHTSPIKMNQGSPLLSSPLNKDLLNDDTTATMTLIEGFNDKMRSLEDIVNSFRRRVDQKNGTGEREEQMIMMFIREMNEKFRGFENMFKEMGNMNGKLVDALINNTKNKEMRDNLDASRYEVDILNDRLRAAAEANEKLNWQGVQWFNYNQKLEAELREERRKNAAIIQEYEILGRENENIIAGIQQESAWRSQQGSRSFDVYKENIALRDRVEVLVTQVRELEKNNARLTQETQGLAKDRMRLSERLRSQDRSRSGSLERQGSPNESIRDQRVPTMDYLRNTTTPTRGNEGMNNSRHRVQNSYGGGLKVPENRERIMSFGEQEQVKRGMNTSPSYPNQSQMRNSHHNMSPSSNGMGGSGTKGNIRQFNASMMVQPTYNTDLNVPPLDTQVVVNHMMNNHNVSFPLLNSQGIKVYNPNGSDLNNSMSLMTSPGATYRDMNGSQNMSNSGKLRPKRQRTKAMSTSFNMNNDQFIQMSNNGDLRSQFMSNNNNGNNNFNPFNSTPKITDVNMNMRGRQQNSPNPMLNNQNNINNVNQVINLRPAEGRQSPDISLDNGGYSQGQPFIDVGRFSVNSRRGNMAQNMQVRNSVQSYNLQQRSH